MNTNRFMLVLPALLMPYLVVLALFVAFGSGSVPAMEFVMETVFHGNGLLVPIAMVIYTCIAFVLCAVCFFVSIAKKWDALSLAKTAMIIKLIQLPAYAVLFIAGLICAILPMMFFVTLLILVFNYITLIMTGSLNIAAVIVAGHDRSMPLKGSLWIILLQFVFCADVVASIVFYVKLRTARQSAEALQC